MDLQLQELVLLSKSAFKCVILTMIWRVRTPLSAYSDSASASDSTTLILKQADHHDTLRTSFQHMANHEYV
jgi:hypothetical protein